MVSNPSTQELIVHVSIQEFQTTCIKQQRAGATAHAKVTRIKSKNTPVFLQLFARPARCKSGLFRNWQSLPPEFDFHILWGSPTGGESSSGATAPFFIQNPLNSWIPEIYILEKVEPTVGCTVVEHLNCTAHNGLWMDWRNNPNRPNGPGRVLCTSKKHHFVAFLGVHFIEIDSSFWKIFSQNFRGELPHIEPSLCWLDPQCGSLATKIYKLQ